VSVARTAAAILGAAYVLLGVVGFLPDPLVQASAAPGASGALLGILPINAALNVVHLAIGGSLLYASMATASAIIAARIIGVVCVVLGLLGLVSAGPFGPLPLGGAEILLHLGTGALLLAIGVTNSAE
jgi:uncharacterized protein DUF4383